jgi:Fe-S-cluster containining protein
MRLRHLLERCKTCTSGSCCREGVELSRQEIRRIVSLNPKVKKPWFRLVDEEDQPQPPYIYETIVRDNRCVFQDKHKRCLVYKVRPKACAEFPLDNGRIAQYYKRLCSRSGPQKDWY